MPSFAAGGIATPADAALCMALGAESVFVGSGIFLSADPARRARAIVEAVTHWEDAERLAKRVRGARRRDAGPRDRDAREGRAARGAGLVMVGVLALQGGFDAHVARARELGHETRAVRVPGDLAGLDGLVLPGGESTTMLRLLDELEAALDAFVRAGHPVLATCAGLVLAARTVTDPAQRSFGWIDVAVARNAWGRQVESFEAKADDTGEPLVFIRAPRITARGRDVEVLATFDGEPVLVRQANVYGATFHPELTEDRRIHRRVFGG